MVVVTDAGSEGIGTVGVVVVAVGKVDVLVFRDDDCFDLWFHHKYTRNIIKSRIKMVRNKSTIIDVVESEEVVFAVVVLVLALVVLLVLELFAEDASVLVIVGCGGNVLNPTDTMAQSEVGINVWLFGFNTLTIL